MSIKNKACAYVQRFEAAVSQCSCIMPSDRNNIPTHFDDKRNVCIIVRGFDSRIGLFENNPITTKPFELVFGGNLTVYVRIRNIRTSGTSELEICSYRFCVRDLKGNCNGITSFRYDKPEGQPRDSNWDKELGDNPLHPWAHLHINFDQDANANECRLPTGPICPILLLRAFNHWYRKTFQEP